MALNLICYGDFYVGNTENLSKSTFVSTNKQNVRRTWITCCDFTFTALGKPHSRPLTPSSGWMLIQQGAKVVKQLFLDQARGTTYVSWWTPIGPNTPPCWPIAGRHLFAGATLKYALRFLLRQPARWSATGSTSLRLSAVKKKKKKKQ